MELGMTVDLALMMHAPHVSHCTDINASLLDQQGQLYGE